MGYKVVYNKGTSNATNCSGRTKVTKEIEYTGDVEKPKTEDILEKNIYIKYAQLVVPPLAAWTDPNPYDCLFATAGLYRANVQANFGKTANAFVQPFFHYNSSLNQQIEGEQCLVRRGQVLCGIETTAPHMVPDMLDPTSEVLYEHNLYPNNTMVLGKCLLDGDDGTWTYVGQECFLKGHGQANPFPAGSKKGYDLSKKVTLCL